MRMGVLAIICIHMLLWAGCNSTPSFYKLGSDENLLTTALHFNQPSKGLWRKLLEEKVSVPTESKSVRESNTHTQSEEKTDAKNVKIENVDVDAKKDAPKLDLNAPVAHKEEVQSESVAAHITQNNTKTKEEPKIAHKEEVRSESAAAGTVQNDRKMKEEPEITMLQEASKEEQNFSKQHKSNAEEKTKESDTHSMEKEKIEKTEDSTGEALVQSQDVQIKGMSPSDTNEDAAKVLEMRVETEENAQQTPVANLQEADSTVQTEEKHADAVSVEETPGVKIHVGESKDVSNVDMQDKDVSNADTQDKQPKSVKEEISVVAVVDNDKGDSTPEQKENPETSEGEQQDQPTEERGSVGESIAKKEEIAEGNPIRMVEMDSDVVQLELKDDDSNKINSLAINANGTDDSNRETSNASVDDEKVEEKHVSNAEIVDKKDDNDATQEASQVASDAKIEEKLESSDDDTELKDKDSTDTATEESQEEKAEESHESSDDNTEGKDKEGEDKEVILQVKTDDETEAAAREVESQLEALKRDTVLETPPDEQKQVPDPSDDEYDIIQELVDLPTKFQETAGKVADHLRPDVLKWTDTSKVYFNFANQQITESFSPLIGKQYAPFFASMISYGILLLPLIVVILLFEHIKALFSLQKVLLFVNIYLAAYFATLWLASFIIGLEPMSFFYLNSLSTYLSLQLLQALGYVVYLILQTANVINSCTSDTLVGKVTSVLQWVVAMTIGLHYYVTVFHPAVASKPPHTSWKFYAIYSAAFFILCLFARIKWVKKEYVSSGSDMANKKS